MTMDEAETSFDPGAVVIEGERIAVVGPEALAQDYRAAEVLDASEGIVMPGLINAHTHAAMTLFRGLADDLPLLTWLEEHIFPAEAKLDAELVAVGTRLACAEMILSGTTCFCDMYLWEDTVAEVANQVGLRAAVGEVLYDFPSPHYGDLASGFAFTEEFIAHYRGHPRISVMIKPHALYTCAPGLLKKAQDLAVKHEVDLHIHLAETETETSQILEAYGLRPVGHLDDLGLLTGRLLAAHMVCLDEGEIELLAARGVRVAHCPESNMKLASGVAPLMDLLRAGVCVGLGTDGAASNNDLSMLGEMRSCALIHKAARLDPTTADAATVLRLATAAAAEAVGLGRQIGTLEPGKKADVIVLDAKGPHMTPLYEPRSHLVYAALPSDVRHSVVEGRVLMAERELKTIDLEKLRAEVDRAKLKIRA